MLGVEAMAERMGHDVVGHHPTMPGAGEAAQAFVATRCLKDSLHEPIMTILWCVGKTFSSAGRFSPTRRVSGASHTRAPGGWSLG
jgi:hypothetical protein